jgi:hypothetical protein
MAACGQWYDVLRRTDPLFVPHTSRVPAIVLGLLNALIVYL